MLHDNLESRITFEVPSSTADFDKLIRDNNYTLFWQNLHSTGESGLRSGSGASELLAGHKDRNATSDYGQLMGSLRGFAGERGGPYGWGLPDEVGLGVDGAGPLVVDPSYLWIGAVMVLLVLSGLFCVCSCYLYYKYRRWQKCVSITSCHQTAYGGTLVGDVESPPPYDPETTTTAATLPSYTVASGLPSYEDAVEHIYRQQQLQRQNPPPASVHPPATVKFFESRPQNWLAVTIFEEIHYNFVGRGGTTTTTSPSTVVTIPEKVEDESEGDLLDTWRQQQQHEEKPRPLGRR